MYTGGGVRASHKDQGRYLRLPPVFYSALHQESMMMDMYTLRFLEIKPVFHFARIVAKRTGEHAQIEKRLINPRTCGCIQHRGKTLRMHQIMKIWRGI